MRKQKICQNTTTNKLTPKQAITGEEQQSLHQLSLFNWNQVIYIIYPDIVDVVDLSNNVGLVELKVTDVDGNII